MDTGNLLIFTLSKLTQRFKQGLHFWLPNTRITYLDKKPTGSPLETLSEENSRTANFGHVNSKLKTDFPFRGNGDASPEVSKEKHFQQKSNVKSFFP